MKTVPLFGSSLKSLSPVASAQERINVFFDIHEDGDKQQIIVRGTPALTEFVTLPQSPIRGMLAIDQYLYVVADNGLYQIGANGNWSLLGYFGAGGQTAPVEMTNNPTQLIIVDGTNGGWIYNFSNVVAAVTVQVATLQLELIDITTIAQQYQALSSTPSTSGSPTAANPGVVPRVVTPRIGGIIGGIR